MIAPAAPMTADEFAELPGNGRLDELVKGVPVAMNMPTPRHGEICFRAGYLLQRFLDDHPLGRIVSNDAGVLTEHDPDTVRGPDVAFYSYARVPKGPLPRRGYLKVVPEVVFEVRSPTDAWTAVREKVAEYLQAGVETIVVLDDPTSSAHVYRQNEPPRVLDEAEELTLLVSGEVFRVRVGRFFE